MKKLKKLKQKAWMDTKTSIEYCIIKGCRLYLKSFKPSLLAGTTTTLWQAILILRKPRSLLIRKIIGQALKKMLKPMSKATTFVWP